MSTFFLNVPPPPNRNFGDTISVQDLRGIHVLMFSDVPPPNQNSGATTDMCVYKMRCSCARLTQTQTHTHTHGSLSLTNTHIHTHTHTHSLSLSHTHIIERSALHRYLYDRRILIAKVERLLFILLTSALIVSREQYCFCLNTTGLY